MNNIKTKQHLMPWLASITMVFMVLAMATVFIEQQINIVSMVLTSIAVFFFIAFFVLWLSGQTITSNKASNKSPSSGQGRKITTLLIIIISSLLFIGGSNYWANKINVRWDVTQNKQHTLSTNTMAFIETLNTPVKLTAFYVGSPPKYLQDLFAEYQRISQGEITTEIIDPIEQISYAAQFGNLISGQEHKVIVQAGTSRKDLDFTNKPLSEQQLTNAIASVSRPPRQVYFLTGHGEYALSDESNIGLSTFKQLLADNNILSTPLMLGINNNIPDNCDVLIIAGPRNALTSDETNTIRDYLTKGGDVLFLIEHTVITTAGTPLTDAQQNENPSLNNILNEWGLNIQSDIIVDLTNHVGDDVGSPATKNYQKHKAITQGLDYTFYVRPRSIQLLPERRASIKVAPIVMTASSTNSWAETNRHLAIEYNLGIDTAGPVPLSYVLFEEKVAGDLSDTRIIVFTDADFLTNVYIKQYSNAQMGLNIVNWLAELDHQTYVGAKDIEVERLDLTSKQKRQVIVVLFLIPLFFVIVGLFVWLRAKNND